MKYQETTWIEMKPYCYDGENHDQIKPSWYGFSDGDKGGETVEILEMLPKHFPPGTKIVVSEPCCPGCDTPASFCLDTETGKMSKCNCGLEGAVDWEQWTLHEYS